jgi:hypothetical protein
MGPFSWAWKLLWFKEAQAISLFVNQFINGSVCFVVKYFLKNIFRFMGVCFTVK